MIFEIMRKLALCLLSGGLALPLAALASAQTADLPQTTALGEMRHAVTVQSAWVRALPPAAKVGAGYFEITNNSDTALRLFSVQTDIAQKVEIHSMSVENNIMKMRHLGDGVEIPPHSRLSFKPGSYHLMFINPKMPFKAGKHFKARFKFTNGEEMEVPFTVRTIRPGNSKPGGKMHNSAALH